LCYSTTGFYIKDKDISVSKVCYRNASKHRGITFHRRHILNHNKIFCKLKIRTVVTEEGTSVQLFAQCGKGQVLYTTTLHLLMMVLYITTLLSVSLVGRKIRRSLEIHKCYTVSLVSRQLSQHIPMDAGLLRNTAAVLMRMIKETFCRRPAKSWEDNY
jgi:hypothetical protein